MPKKKKEVPQAIPEVAVVNVTTGSCQGRVNLMVLEHILTNQTPSEVGVTNMPTVNTSLVELSNGKIAFGCPRLRNGQCTVCEEIGHDRMVHSACLVKIVTVDEALKNPLI